VKGGWVFKGVAGSVGVEGRAGVVLWMRAGGVLVKGRLVFG